MQKKGELYFPTKEFQKKAWLKDKKIYREADKSPIKFWEKLAKELFWFKKWQKAFEHKPPYFKWFVGGKINITENIFEKNPQGWEEIKNKTALIWEPEPEKEKPIILTYQELFQKVNRFANGLKKLGVEKGDRVGIYLPMIPEVIISMLACARIGAVHTVVFSAFSPAALRVRLQITGAKVLITADGYYRRGQIINLKESADEGIKGTEVKKLIVVKRAGNKISWNQEKDIWHDDLIKNESDKCETEVMDSEDPFFILFTSGTTGVPKGTLHTCGGYTVQANFTGKWIFDLHKDDIMWCVPGNTKIITNFGQKEVGEIKPGDRVLSHKGNFVKVLRIFKRPYRGDLIRIKTYYSNEPILISPNHKILVSKDRVGPFEWIPASEIKKGYHLLFPIPRGEKGYKRILEINNYLDETKYLKTNGEEIFSSKGIHKIPNRLKINDDFMRLCGYYVAEGSVDEDSIYFNFGKHEKSYIKDTIELIQKIFKTKAKIKESHAWAAPVYVNSRIIARLFEKLFGSYAVQKKLPNWFISLPQKLISEFIKGFWRGDGYLAKDGIEIDTTSQILAIQLKLLLLKSGVISSLQFRPVDKNKIRYVNGRKFTYKNDIYRLTITGTSLSKISEIIGINHPFLSKRSKTYHRGKITGNFLWTKVTSVNKVPYQGPVYNLETEAGTYALSSFCVHNCTADIGWITSHTYGCYSPLLNGITSIMFEGAPDWPTPDRWAKIIEKHKVTTFYTAPTAIRMFEKYGTKVIEKYKFESLQLLGSVGESIDESAWLWYFKEVGKERCPIVDTWWQTESGGILITSLPGIGPFKPAFVGLPFPGVKVDILNEKGRPCKENEAGNLVLLPPFAPGLLRGIYKNPQKYLETYWSQYAALNVIKGELRPGGRGKKVYKIYFTSDAAHKDENGLIRIIGRVDDVIKMAGHRLSTGELEAAVNLHPDITECAVIGIPDEIKGEAPVVFIVYKGQKSIEEVKKEAIEHIKEEIGPIALPKEVYLVEDLPKTRSGKIMRRILRKLFTGEELGDLSTLANPEIVEKIKRKIYEKQK